MTTDDRDPPQRVRMEKLQEIHVPDLKKVDAACAEQYWALGFDAAEVPVRTSGDFYRLPKSHAVWVAEADGQVAGFIAFRDESPGVGYIEDIAVHPELQRFGIGRRLIEKARLELAHLGFVEVVLKVKSRARWAVAFYEALGFHTLGDPSALGDPNAPDVPERVAAWRAEKVDEEDRPYLRPGEDVMWGLTRPREDDEEDG